MAKGTITHIEFPAKDVERAKRFYAAVAGWEFGEMQPGYWTFRSEEGHGGGIGRAGESVGDNVRVYITVDSVDDSVGVAEANGGRVLTPPTDIGGGYGRYAAIIDPEGNEIGLWQAAPEA
ncbi:MAG: VOC family protein [Chloroflexi bacterium]|nr:VOC family protein [Chloroflexota bacterium]